MKKKKNNQLKYIVPITFLLFAFVFAFNLPKLRGGNDVSADGSETSITSGSPDTDTTPPVIETIPPEAVKPDIDNEWALILVNNHVALPENYEITAVPVQSYYELDERCAPYMKEMISDAQKAGITLRLISAYRSVEYQQKIFDNDVQRYISQGMTEEEAKAKTALNIAMPGKSEHNLGLAADIADDSWQGEITEEFENTEAFTWLYENCWKYGFILRYPKGKEAITEFVYEPWHYRFVGKYHAKRIMESGLSLEEYMEQIDNGTLPPAAETTEAPSVTSAPVTETSYSQKVTIIA